MFYTWIPCRRNRSPSQRPTRQPLPNTVLPTRQMPTKNQQKAKPIHSKVYRRSWSCHTIHQRPSEQYRHTLAIYRVIVFFKGISTIKSLLMHPKDPILDAQKTDIIYHWKCPANNCMAEYIDEANKSLKERVSDHRNQTASAIRNHHISTKHPKAELKDFTIIDRKRNTLHHWAKVALHIHIKDPSLNRNIGKVRIPSVFKETSQTSQTTRTST